MYSFNIILGIKDILIDVIDIDECVRITEYLK